jgi:hypothetical protein
MEAICPSEMSVIFHSTTQTAEFFKLNFGVFYVVTAIDMKAIIWYRFTDVSEEHNVSIFRIYE